MLAPFSSIKLSRTNNERKSVDKVSEIVERLYNERYLPPTNYNIHIMVSEVNCTQPDCVPIETVIIIMSELKSEDSKFSKPKKWIGKILKPVTQVTQEDLTNLEFPLIHDHTFTDILTKIQVEPVTLNRERARVEMITENFIINVCDAIQELEASLQSSLLPIMIERLKCIDKEALRRVNNSITEAAGAAKAQVINNADSKNEEVVQAVKMKKREESNYVNTPAESEYFSPGFQPDVIHRLEQIQSRKFISSVPKGCSCCDPDNIDTILHQLMMQAPP